MIDRATAGALLRDARTRAGLSQAELARRSGIAQSVVSVYESGRRQPSLPTLSTLIKATGSTLEVRLGSAADLLPTLADRIRSHAPDIEAAAGKHGVKILGLFGSAARGDDHEGSDVDLLLDVPEGVGLLELGRLEAELRRLVGAEVDLVPEAGLKPRLRQNILADLRPL